MSVRGGEGREEEREREIRIYLFWEGGWNGK